MLERGQLVVVSRSNGEQGERQSEYREMQVESRIRGV